MRLARVGHSGDDASILGHAANAVHNTDVVDIDVFNSRIVVEAFVVIFVVFAVLIVRFCFINANYIVSEVDVE